MGRGRHYGMDWLRIAAFGGLIVYHAAMIFAPWHWVIKAPQTYPALIAPMAALTPWRLPLLFAVSGYASRLLFERSGSLRGFVGSRNRRLLVPLAFGMAVLVPPEAWVRARLAGGTTGFLDYWAGPYWHDHFPSWEHLWFVAYLWAYTMMLAALVGWAGVARLDRWAATLAAGRRLLWLPIAALVAAKLAMMFVVPETQGLLVDWTAHAQYFPVLLFGFVLAGSGPLWAAVLGAWRGAAAVAAASLAVVVWTELHWPGPGGPGHAMMALDRAARLAAAWSMVLLACNVAERSWNRDHRWRPLLAEAVFPCYLVHQPAIVLIAWWLLPLGWPPPVLFLAVLAGTAAACAMSYLGGREIGWLRPLIGLRRIEFGAHRR